MNLRSNDSYFIAFPCFRSEIESANQKKMKYTFSHYLMFAKTYATPEIAGRPAGKMYVNPEEELFLQVMPCHAMPCHANL